MSRKALITGITGQDGAYLAELLVSKGYEVHGVKRRSSLFNTSRIDHLFKDPHEDDVPMLLHHGDMTDSTNLIRLVQTIEPDEIYNLAAQSHVFVSFETPEYTANADAIGTLRLLEAIRILGLEKTTRLYQASTSELYGKVIETPQSETTPFCPRSPYAAAKLYAYWIVVNYREAYGMHASNGILFNHESPIRGETFVTRKITRAVAAIHLGLQDTLYIGNLDAKRDWGHARDYVEGMWRIVQQVTPDDYVLAIRAVLSDRTRAVIVVHGFGQPADMDPILDVARAHGVKVIEDTAESIGSRYKGRLCGTMGDVGSFSLYANKLITTGEGGCILTDDEAMADRARRYINLYFGLDERFSHEGLGYNFRMTNMQAALGVAQLEQIDAFTARKREIGRWYAEELATCDRVDFQKTMGDVDHVYWMYCVVLRDHVQMDAMAAMAHLGARGIGTRNLFKGLHAQAPLQPHLLPEDKTAAFPVTERLYARGFYVPSAVTLTRDDVRSVVAALRELS